VFGRKKPKISLFDYYININEPSISDWIDSGLEIGCESEWRTNDSGVVRHIINYLPKSGVHFHRTPGVFSESVAGGYRTRDDVDIEWGISDQNFIVWAPMEDKVLFSCPIARASQMLSTGHNDTQNLRGESHVLAVELGEKHKTCRKVREKTWDTYSLRYSNNLVEVVFEIAPKHNVLYYDSYHEPK
jgi:hypothetical protein